MRCGRNLARHHDYFVETVFAQTGIRRLIYHDRCGINGECSKLSPILVACFSPKI